MASSCSAETVANIEGLLKQILISVPALSLLRFKSVSKHWLSLISDSDFRRRHSLRNPNPKVSAFFSPKTNDSFNSIPLQTPPSNPFKSLQDSNLTILQSCNGLFLLAGDHQSNRHPHHPVHVVNPTTNESRTLSAPSLANLEDDSYMFVRYGLAFEPRISPHYSVVCVSHDEIYRKRHRIEIYSSETGAWGRSLEAPFFLRPSDLQSYMKPLHFDDSSKEGAVYCNGALHWMRKSRAAGWPLCHERIGEIETEGFVREESDVVHYFDIGEESLQIATAAPPVPQVVKELYLEYKQEGKLLFPDSTQRYFGESGGGLCLIEVFKHCPTRVEVMEMERDYSGWFVKCCVDLGPVVAPLPGQEPSAFVVLFLEKDDEDSTADLWLHMPGKVIFYNLSTMSFRTSVELDSEEHFLALDDDDKYESGSFSYMETLACV